MATHALPGSRRENALAAISEWIIKRGILSLFLLMPGAAVLVGYVLRLIPLPVATFGVFLSFDVFAAWVSYRLTASDDPDEPVHQLHRYALYALLPIAMFSQALILAFVAADVAFWPLWYEFGAELTREPNTQPWSLAAGVVVHVLVGMGFVMSYYVLVRRHSLFNAALLLGMLVPALVFYLSAVFSVAGAQLGPAWHVTFWLAFGVGAVTAWVMPMFWPWVGTVLRGRAGDQLVARRAAAD